EKRIASLVEDGIIAGIEPGRNNYQLFFCMAIQFVPKYSKRLFSFGKPEGIRVFISLGRKVVAGIDFIFHKNDLKFSHIYQGPPVGQLIKTIKKLQRSYSRSKGKAHMELIQFFFIRTQFILVKAGWNRSFYRNARGKLTKISLPELKNEIEPILKDPPRFERH
ncbi:MAG TPA: hypothetical protein VI461_15205, partial [Chitinophagaceae bacterium]|nr:hypothetical protein [Chitinophagaceae bacterium]